MVFHRTRALTRRAPLISGVILLTSFPTDVVPQVTNGNADKTLQCEFDRSSDVSSSNIRIIVGRSPIRGAIDKVCILYGDSPLTRQKVIDDINSKRASYFVCHRGSTPQVHVVNPPPDQLPYIRTDKSPLQEDDLGNLPDC